MGFKLFFTKEDDYCSFKEKTEDNKDETDREVRFIKFFEFFGWLNVPEIIR